MDSDKYLEGQFMQRPSLFESDSFIYWKNKFETYVKSKDLDLLHVIIKVDFPTDYSKSETKLDEVVPFENQTDDLKRRLSKNNEAKISVQLSGSKDEASLAMAVKKNFKKFFKRKKIRCGDPNHLIGECPKPPRDKNQRAFVGGSWSDSGEENDEKDKTRHICLGVDLEPDKWIKDSDALESTMTGQVESSSPLIDGIQ
ncbi:hypothetical protein Tco_1070177 [Tanacetum coccineum]|uniref:Zf-CCHC domain-containing protein/DUF4219 domain-containing protein/UBN2 domain-containing protein n=1 Tax=Tanacetum coccineum TaxID=301880 RepID=A0ABQ5HKM3_9ASTR